MMQTFHERVNQCSEEEGDEILAEWAACFWCLYRGDAAARAFVGERIRMGVERRATHASKGNDRLEPIYQAYSRIRYGCAFDIGTFYQRAVWIADQAPFFCGARSGCGTG